MLVHHRIPSIKWLGVLPTLPGWDGSPSQAYLQQLVAGFHLYTCVERDNMDQSFLQRKQQNTEVQKCKGHWLGYCSGLCWDVKWVQCLCWQTLVMFWLHSTWVNPTLVIWYLALEYLLNNKNVFFRLLKRKRQLLWNLSKLVSCIVWNILAFIRSFYLSLV